MKCGRCGTKMVRVETHECPNCGKELVDFKDAIHLQKRKLAMKQKKSK